MLQKKKILQTAAGWQKTRFFALGGTPFQTKNTCCRPLKQFAVGIHNAGLLCTIEHIMCSL
ncbi:MAG: hypothetical protein IJ995_02695 [Clostridia bacterium]|nr:hypothetical protein [Clostridia bacterium]